MVRVKICGITNAVDALAAIDAGANLLGFNFYAKSPRCISEGDAAIIRSQLPKKIKAVGIFVNTSPAEVAALCKSLKLHAAQLHGDETPEDVAELASSLPVFKAFRVEPDFPWPLSTNTPRRMPFCLTPRIQANMVVRAAPPIGT